MEPRVRLVGRAVVDLVEHARPFALGDEPVPVPPVLIRPATRLVGELAAAMERPGVEVLDRSSDPDHHRSVVTLLGEPGAVEDAVFDAAALAVDAIDLRRHQGVHPRIGALDVLPFVPLAGLRMEDAVASAHRVGRRIADELRVPVYWYGAASTPPGRRLAALRRGGFEGLVEGTGTDRAPDLLPDDWDA